MAVLEKLRTSYWFLPGAMTLAGIALAFVCIDIDRNGTYNALQKLGIIFSAGPQGARAVLSAIATSIITVAGTSFSIMVAALSLTSAQFGPRLLRNFMRDTGNQVVLGTFTGTFIYCILVLRTVEGNDGNTYVPHVSITLGVYLAVLSVALLIFFIHHVAESIQASHLIQIAGEELDNAVQRLFPEKANTETEPRIPSGGDALELKGTGFLQEIDEDALLRVASRCDLLLVVTMRPGDYALPGSVAVRAFPAIDEPAAKAVLRAFTVDRRRTPFQDAAYGFEQIAEIAVRALSSGINDPFTANMCVDRITAAMCRLGRAFLPPPARRDKHGKVRVIAHPYRYEDLVASAYRHIWEAAGGQAEVRRHLLRRLEFAALQAETPDLKVELQNALQRFRRNESRQNL